MKHGILPGGRRRATDYTDYTDYFLYCLAAGEVPRITRITRIIFYTAWRQGKSHELHESHEWGHRLHRFARRKLKIWKCTNLCNPCNPWLLVKFVVMQDNPIVLFDGVCNYCNAMVNFAIRNDKKGVLKFCPLQSKTGIQLKEKYKIPASIDSVILIDQDKVYYYADAAIRIAKYLQWPARALYGLIIIPKFIRQPFYKWVAKNRYKWFGKKETCMIPRPEVKARFLE